MRYKLKSQNGFSSFMFPYIHTIVSRSGNLFNNLRTGFNKTKSYQDDHNAFNHLLDLSNHELEDIGLTRSDLIRAHKLSNGQNTTATLQQIVRKKRKLLPIISQKGKEMPIHQATLEHVNITVSNPQRTAEMLCRIFGWKIRWHGEAINDGISYHVGSDDSYVAVYSGKVNNKPAEDNYETAGGLNHVGIVVDDIDAVEKLVVREGFEPHSHANYEPGKRFYFQDYDDIEIEVISYA